VAADTAYTAGIRDAYFGELAAERVYRELAQRAAEPLQQEKFAAIADLEQRTARALAPLARRLQIAIADADIESRAAERLTALGALSFDAFITQAAERWPTYITSFVQLAGLAPREDADALQLLVSHERALVRFVELEREQPGGRQSLQPLKAWLALMPRSPAAT
jgi:rubrerythrin